MSLRALVLRRDVTVYRMARSLAPQHARPLGMTLARKSQMQGFPGRLAQTHSSVATQHLSTSATLHAWAMQPRGVYGGSASKISLIDPTQASLTWF